MNARVGDISKRFVRAGRLQESGGNWYYVTREGTVEGPFASREAAEDSLDAYVQFTSSKLFDKDSLSRINGLSLEPLE